MLPDPLRNRFWREAEDRHAYVVLDGAQNAQLLDWLYGPDAPRFECLLTGDKEPDMAEVAPYLCKLEPGSRFATEVVEKGWGPNWGVLLTSREDLPRVWRHLRQQFRVYGPDLEPLFFRFYDPRVLRMFLPSCDGKQLADFFGCVDFFLSEGEAGAPAHAWSVADGKLVQEEVTAA
jgi:hypothetical protein